jgi:hypothetical protein
MNDDTSCLRRPASNRKRRNQPRAPSPSVAAPRRSLLLAVLGFVRAARACPGVQRISLLGSILTAKVIPKDVDVLVTIDAAMDLSRLARSGRRLMGQAQTINLGADIFLAIRRGVTLVASAVIANAIHVFSATPCIAGSGTILTTIFISSRYHRS